MRIKWTAIHSVVDGSSTAPLAGPVLTERVKRETVIERTKKEKEKESKSERAVAWFRRSR
jgi:hypothetical protein